MKSRQDFEVEDARSAANDLKLFELARTTGHQELEATSLENAYGKIHGLVDRLCVDREAHHV